MSRTVLEILLKTAFAAAESIVQKKFCCCYYLVKGIVSKLLISTVANKC